VSQEALTPGTAPFLEALAALLAEHGDEKMDTLPEDGEILTKSIVKSPFEWIGFALWELEAGPAGTRVSDVIEAMGINAFVCPGSGRLIDGHHAQLGFALGIGSKRKGATMTGIQVAEAVRNVIDVLPRTN
jgi:hypothetical protein